MTSYEELFEEAEHLRDQWRCRRAIKRYRAAYKRAVTRDETRDALHMLGVTYKMLGQMKLAESCLIHAEQYVDVPPQRADILRDHADVCSLNGEHVRALALINQSLELLPAKSQAYGASLGFKGRVLQRSGNLNEALGCYSKASHVLVNEQRLFNLIPFANALSQQGNREGCVNRLYQARDLRRKHGAWSHRFRICALRIGGYRLDNFVQKSFRLRGLIPV